MRSVNEPLAAIHYKAPKEHIQFEFALAYSDQKQLKKHHASITTYLDKVEKRIERDRIDANKLLYGALSGILDITFDGVVLDNEEDFSHRVKFFMADSTIKRLESTFGRTKLKSMLTIATVRKNEVGKEDFCSDLNPHQLSSKIVGRRDIQIEVKRYQDGQAWQEKTCLLCHIESNGNGDLGTDGFFYMANHRHSKFESEPSLLIKFGKTNDITRRQTEQQSDHCANKLMTPDITATENKFRGYFEELDVIVLEETVKHKNIELVYMTQQVWSIMASLNDDPSEVEYHFVQEPAHVEAREFLVKSVCTAIEAGVSLSSIIEAPAGRSFSTRLSMRFLGELVTIVVDLMGERKFTTTTKEEVFEYCSNTIGLSHEDSLSKASRYDKLVRMIKKYDLLQLEID